MLDGLHQRPTGMLAIAHKFSRRWLFSADDRICNSVTADVLRTMTYRDNVQHREFPRVDFRVKLKLEVTFLSTSQRTRGRRAKLRNAIRTMVCGLAMTVGGAAKAGDGHRVPDLYKSPKKVRVHAHSRILVPLTIHLATEDEPQRRTLYRLKRAVERANRALARHGIEVVVHRVLRMPDGYSSITRRRDRRKLAQYAALDGTVHVFFVDHLELGSLTRGDREVRGMHWRYRGLRRKLRHREYISINSDAPSTTLAHEVGHLFGLDHDRGHRNLMCSCRRGRIQRFTHRQGARMRLEARAFFLRNRRFGGR